MKTLVLVAALPLVLLLSSCRAPCSSSNCTGCCDASGSCQLGTTSLACGVSGSTCSACNLGATCNLGQCFGGTGAGGGLGGGTGGGTTGGGTGGGTTGGGTGGGTTGGGTGGAGGTWSSFCQTYFSEYYGLYARCGAVTQAYLQQYYLASYRAYCDQTQPPGLKDGRSTLNQPGIDQCLAALRSATCTSPYTCEFDVLLGTVGLNGNCYDSTDCQSAFFCDNTTTCPGRCVPRIAAGQAVGPYQECVKSAFVYNNTCVPLVAAGQSCAPMGGSTVTLDCAPPATCLPSQLCGTLTLASANSPCTDSCAVGLQCVANVCVPLGTVNAACDSARRCQGGLNCSAANVCVAPTVVGLGATCSVDRVCDSTVAFCDAQSGSQTGTCVALRGPNGTCESQSQCQANLLCKGPVGASVCSVVGPPRMLNETCSFDTGPCVSGTYCTATSTVMTGVCANEKGESASCVEDRECQSNDCLSSMCTRPSCEDPTP